MTFRDIVETINRTQKENAPLLELCPTEKLLDSISRSHYSTKKFHLQPSDDFLTNLYNNYANLNNQQIFFSGLFGSGICCHSWILSNFNLDYLLDDLGATRVKLNLDSFPIAQLTLNERKESILISQILSSLRAEGLPNFHLNYGWFSSSSPLWIKDENGLRGYLTYSESQPILHSIDELLLDFRSDEEEMSISDSLSMEEMASTISKEEFISILFQIVSALYISHQRFGFSHQSLFARNVRIRKLPSNCQISYRIENETITLSTQVIAVISNFELSVIQKDEITIGNKESFVGLRKSIVGDLGTFLLDSLNLMQKGGNPIFDECHYLLNPVLGVSDCQIIEQLYQMTLPDSEFDSLDYLLSLKSYLSLCQNSSPPRERGVRGDCELYIEDWVGSDEIPQTTLDFTETRLSQILDELNSVLEEERLSALIRNLTAQLPNYFTGITIAKCLGDSLLREKVEEFERMREKILKKIESLNSDEEWAQNSIQSLSESYKFSSRF